MTDKKIVTTQESFARVLIREGHQEDDAQICAQIRRNTMPGRISLASDYEPSFFSAIEVEGYEPRVIVAESGDQIVGTGLMTKRRVYLNGNPSVVGYISSLRTDLSIRSTTAIARGNRLMKQVNDEWTDVPFFLCAILRDNLNARQIITSGRVGLPPCKEIGTMCSVAIPLIKRRLPRLSDSIKIMRGGVVGAVRIVEFLNRIGKEKQFFPVYTVDDLISDNGILKGLALDDFYVAVNGDRILGVIACWNQLPFRRMVVSGYAGYVCCLKPLLTPLASALHLAPMPNPGESLRNVYASCIAIEDNNPQIFKQLLNAILSNEYNTGKSFLVTGLMENDLLLPALKKYLHIPTRTCIYAMSWDGLEAVNQLDGRYPYLELGGL